jgi:hypothetical protein
LCPWAMASAMAATGLYANLRMRCVWRSTGWSRGAAQRRKAAKAPNSQPRNASSNV